MRFAPGVHFSVGVKRGQNLLAAYSDVLIPAPIEFSPNGLGLGTDPGSQWGAHFHVAPSASNGNELFAATHGSLRNRTRPAARCPDLGAQGSDAACPPK